MRISRSPARFISEITVDQNIPMAGFKLTGLAAGAAAGESVRFEQIALIPTMQRKAADETVNNSNVLQNDNDLFFPVAANESWAYYLFLRFISVSVAPDIKFDFAVPAAGVAKTINTASIIGVVNPNAPIPVTNGTAQVWNTEATERGVMMWGVYIGGVNAGNFQLQWAQNVATAENTKVLANSHLIRYKIS